MSTVSAGALAVGLILGTVGGAMADLPTEDAVLRKIIHAYGIESHRPVEGKLGPVELLGQALFFDPVVSGPKSIACATCHVRAKGAGDDLRLAVGLGAKGVGTERLASKDALMIPRNALPFFNRGSTDFVVLFWDGRVQRGPNGALETPLGERLPQGFESPLAAAAVFPLAEPDEMLGRSLVSGKVDTYHGDLVTMGSEEADNFQERTLVVFDNLLLRLLGESGSAPNAVQSAYRALVVDAFPAITPDSVKITHLGNALASYIRVAFELEQSPWDHYVEGNLSALSPDQKKGAILFFGKGRCVVCHSGKQFSDFSFHGLSVPQLGVGKHTRHIDYGRAAATSRGEDRFLFRTSPLRNVMETGPWGHSGVFSSVEAAIRHHTNPVPILYAAQERDPDEAAYAGRLLAARSPLLAEMPPLTNDDVGLLIEYLRTLSSDTVMSDREAVPKHVPSGANEFLN
jgi:cytochrome c peroxidase